MTDNIEMLVIQAQNGSKEALEALINHSQGYIYNLALRMLQLPMDAEDATQEILVKLITHLAQFRGESTFTTWMYRIASNHLLNMRSREEDRRFSFEALSLRLEESLTQYEDTVEEVYENTELVEEVKRGCTLGMLMCLNREDRLSLILGEVFDMSSEEGAYIMGTTSTAYRKRLSRARQSLVAFVSNYCGIVNSASRCRCHKHVRNKIQFGSINPEKLRYVQRGELETSANTVLVEQSELDSSCRTIALLRSHPTYQTSTDFIEVLKQMFTSDTSDNPSESSTLPKFN
jgi:RNA polymerase sigma factor (sigma-70 family)